MVPSSTPRSTQDVPPTSRGIALLIPCFNAADTIERLLNAASQQTEPFAEIICYNDASSDNTEAVIQKVSGVQLLNGIANQGPSAARNQLAKASTAPYLHFHDADDHISSTFVESMTPHLASDQITYCDMLPESHSGEISFPQPGEAPASWVKTLHFNRSIIPRKSYLDAGGCEESLRIAEDTLFQLRMMTEGLRFTHVPELLAEREVRANSILTTMTWAEQFRGNVAMLEHLTKFAPENMRAMIGRQALSLSWDLYYRNCHEEATRAMAVARSCSVTAASNASTAQRLLLTVAGWRTLYFLRRRWAILRGAKPKSSDHTAMVPSPETQPGPNEKPC